MVALLGRLPVSGKVLLTLEQASQSVYLSARNLPGVSTLPANALSTREVLRHDYLVATVPAIRVLERWLLPSDQTPEASVPDAPEVAPARRARAAAAAETATAAAETPAAAVEAPAAAAETATAETETSATDVEAPSAEAEAPAADEERPASRRRSPRKSESDE
jgi:hypothetical protein